MNNKERNEWKEQTERKREKMKEKRIESENVKRLSELRFKSVRFFKLVKSIEPNQKFSSCMTQNSKCRKFCRSARSGLIGLTG